MRFALPLPRLLLGTLAALSTLVLSGCYVTEPLCTASNAIVVPGLDGRFDVALAGDGQSGDSVISSASIWREGTGYVMETTSTFEGRTQTGRQEMATCLVGDQRVLQLKNEQNYQFVLLRPTSTGFDLEQRGLSRDLLRQNGVPFEEYDVTMENKQPVANNAGIAPETILASLDRSERAWTSVFKLNRK